jgi:MYXO-CTERM domain-containing protein
MKTKLRGAVVFMASAGIAQIALAGVIDQNQTDGSVYMAAFSQLDLAQSFQQSANNITGAGILLQAGVGSVDNVVISLWTTLPNGGGSMLAQGFASGMEGEWVDVFWGEVAIDSGTTYYLDFSGNSTLGIAGSVNNPYAGGEVYANPGYVQFADFDYAFRTYAAVPTPGALGLLGFAGIAATRRRR